MFPLTAHTKVTSWNFEIQNFNNLKQKQTFNPVADGKMNNSIDLEND